MKDEVVKGWDHTYNISEDYIHPIIDGELGWCSSSSVSPDSDDALEKWQNHMHEVSLTKCGLPIFEGLAYLSEFLDIFEDRVLEPNWLFPLDEALKDTPTNW